MLKKELIKGDFPLSAFTRAVLKAACKIPLGQTRSYRWIAKQVGRPNAVRGVGQALKKNPFPLLIPCHRVVCFSGEIGGYSGGKKNKQYLLRIERDISGILKGKVK